MQGDSQAGTLAKLDNGLQIIDLSKLPATATLVTEDTSRFRTAHTITQQGNYIYVHGTNPDADLALELWPRIAGFLQQDLHDLSPADASWAQLAQLLGAHLGGESA